MDTPKSTLFYSYFIVIYSCFQQNYSYFKYLIIIFQVEKNNKEKLDCKVQYIIFDILNWNVSLVVLLLGEVYILNLGAGGSIVNRS